MKHGFGRGFFSGVLAAALVVGLGVSALAASRTITVDDDIRITLNGARFLPKDASGKSVPLFSYNGTTYAPVRAICEAAGLQVDYDSASYTAVVTTADAAAAARPDTSGYLSSDRAKEIALNDAGVAAADAVFLKVRLDWDDGRAEYDLEFYAGSTEYDYEIDALSGAIRSSDRDCDDFDLPSSGAGGAGSEAVITADRAKQIALDRAPAGVTVVKCKLDRDDGRLVYEIELRGNSVEYECDVNAVTGVILDWEVDYDD